MSQSKKSTFLIIALLAVSLIAPAIPQVQATEGDFIESWDISDESGYGMGIATDGNFIWVLDFTLEQVFKYSMAGVYTTDNWDISIQSGDPYGLTTDGINIYLADYADENVYKYKMDGDYVSFFDLPAANSEPTGVATDGNFIWVYDYTDKRVYKYAMDGVYTTENWATGIAGNSFGMDTNGDNIWIADHTNQVVYIYEMDGTPVDTWDISAQGPIPRGITVNGYFWIVDSNDNLVHVYEGPPPPILPPSVPDLLFGAGFNATSPYVELHWNHSLVDVQFFEVQNSSDAESWTYLGQSIYANYTDSQVVNGTERYYKVRACNQTDAVWYNSSFTDVNFEKVYFILGTGEFVCAPQFYNASSIDVIVGTLNDGNLASTYFVDGDWYNVSEVTGPPGIDVRVNFTDVGVGSSCFEFFQTFTGHPHHDIEVQIWNFTSTSWNTVGPIFFNETANWACIGLGHYYTHYFDGGNLYARFYHDGVGHVGHEFHVDRIDLSMIQADECPPVDGEPVDDYSIIFLAIGLILMLAIAFLYTRNK